VKAQLRITTGGQHGMDTVGKARQQPAQQRGGLRRVQLVQVVHDHDDAVRMTGQFRQYPVDHRPTVEAGSGRRRFRLAGPRSLPYRVQQGEPEQLTVLLVTLDLDHSHPVLTTRALGPGPEQRRFPAARRRSDDRHLPRHGPVERGNKITPADQSGRASAASCRTRRPPPLVGCPRHCSSISGAARSVNVKDP
jgi:hypothetical protein